MENLDLIIQLHLTQQRQGPGGEAELDLAIELAGLDPVSSLKIADIGCGTGNSSVALAGKLNATVTAVDFLPEFTGMVNARAAEYGLESQIETIVADMAELPFESEQFDVIWSEGAIYNIGFNKGINLWHQFLKPGGKLIVSEITWLTENRPDEINDFWNAAYPEIAMASTKLAQLEKAGYKLLGYFPLPEQCWFENYYQPLSVRFMSLKAQFPDRTKDVESVIAEHQNEIDLYNRFKDYFSYGVYIVEKL